MTCSRTRLVRAGFRLFRYRLIVVSQLAVWGLFLSQMALPVQAQIQSSSALGTLSSAIPLKALQALDVSEQSQTFDTQPQGLEELRAIEESTLALVPEYQKATVGVQVGGGQGSGVVVSPEGHVLTAAHVVGEVGARVTIVFPDGSRHRARVTGVDVGADAAIVRTEGRGPYPFVPMARDHFASTGHWVIAIGHPNGYQLQRLPVVRVGRIIQTTEKTLQSDCSLVGGDSGGPLFDMFGRVVGIHSRIGINNSINFHVPVQIYLRDWDKLTAADEAEPDSSAPREQKAYLGVRGRDATTAGCLVTEVTPNGPAEQGGLRRGDVITHCDGLRVRTFADLVKALSKKQPEDELKLTITRSGARETLTITLGGTEI